MYVWMIESIPSVPMSRTFWNVQNLWGIITNLNIQKKNPDFGNVSFFPFIVYILFLKRTALFKLYKSLNCHRFFSTKYQRFCVYMFAGINCGTIPAVVHSTQYGNSTFYNDTVTFTCDPEHRHEDGYTEKTIICTEGGLWSEEYLSCGREYWMAQYQLKWYLVKSICYLHLRLSVAADISYSMKKFRWHGRMLWSFFW